jgi:hypothetical protein
MREGYFRVRRKCGRWEFEDGNQLCTVNVSRFEGCMEMLTK